MARLGVNTSMVECEKGALRPLPHSSDHRLTSAEREPVEVAVEGAHDETRPRHRG